MNTGFKWQGLAPVPFLPWAGNRYYKTAMYFFFHLLTGIILGLLLGDLLRDRRWVIPCAIGSVLPDLVDKPLDLVIFSQSIGNGYIYGHALVVALGLGVLGLLLLIVWKNPVIVAISAGILSHQVLDLMWGHPKNWLYPLYGAFSHPAESSNIFTLLMSEIENPFEVFLFLFLCAVIALFIARHRIAAFPASLKAGVRSLLACGVFGLCILSGIFIGLSRGNHTLSPLAWTQPEDFILGAIVTAMAGVLFWRWYHKEPGAKRA